MNRRAVTAALGRANWWNFGAPSVYPGCTWGGGELPTWVCPDQNPGGCNSQTPACNPMPNVAGLAGVGLALAGVPGLLVAAGAGMIKHGLGLGACASQQRNMTYNAFDDGMGKCKGPCVGGRCKCWKAGGCACRKG